MPVETPSQFARVIQDHLELKRRNSALEHDMLDPAGGKLMAGRKARLASPDHDGIDPLQHHCSPIIPARFTFSAGVIRASDLRQDRVEPRHLIGGEREALTVLADEARGELQRPHQARA